MKALLAGMIGALVVIVAFVLGTQWTRPRGTRAERAAEAFVGSEYEIHAAANRVFVFDKRTGRAWRYFINFNDKGEPMVEGFTQLSFLNLPTPPQIDLSGLPNAGASPSPFDPDTYLKSLPTPAPSPPGLSPSPQPTHRTPTP